MNMNINLFLSIYEQYDSMDSLIAYRLRVPKVVRSNPIQLYTSFFFLGGGWQEFISSFQMLRMKL